MQIYLKNPLHGKKIAYAEAEASADIMAGWRRCTEDEYFETSKAQHVERVEEKPVIEASEEVVESDRPTGKKRGRKPRSVE